MTSINYSFIIPHKNCPVLLQRCLETIPKRDDIQIIVVDDNSDEGQKPVIYRPDTEVVFLDEEQSKGAGRARNVGLEKAIGKWLLFPDADDFYEKGFLEELDKFVDSSCDIVFFDVYCAINLETGECWKNDYSDYLKRFVENPTNTYLAKSVKHARTEAWHQMYSREYIKSLDVKFHELPSCNDAWFTQFAAVNTSNVSGIDKKLYYWVRNPKSLTNSRHKVDYYRLKEKELLVIKKLKAEQCSWNVITPFWSGLGGLRQREGSLMTLRVMLIRLGNGLIEWRIVWNKYIKRNHYQDA